MRRPRRLRSGLLAGLVLAGCALGWTAIGRRVAELPAGPSAPVSPAERRQQELLKENIGLPGDPALTGRFQQINERHFNGALPPVAVRWEPKLSEVGHLAAEAFTLEGMFGRLGKALLILLNPEVERDEHAIDRALCHEMVHLYLFTTGDETTNHGAAFKTVLARLSHEGAFVGLAGTEEEKTRLRAWLDSESTRLDMDQAEIDRIAADIEHERAAIEAMTSALNERVAAGDPPAPAELERLEERRNRFNGIVRETNARIERGREALSYFNREVERYNLMHVYPDGMDDADRVAVRQGR